MLFIYICDLIYPSYVALYILSHFLNQAFGYFKKKFFLVQNLTNLVALKASVSVHITPPKTTKCVLLFQCVRFSLPRAINS